MSLTRPTRRPEDTTTMSHRLVRAPSGRWLERAVRLGYVARAVLYVTIAMTAGLLAFGRSGGEADGSSGAMQTIASQPFGTAVLWVLAVGLFGYALWRLSQAVLLDPSDGDAPALVQRAYYGLRAVVYGSLGWTAMRIARGSGGGGESGAASLFELPAGRWVVGALGVGIIGYGLFQGYRSVTQIFEDDLESYRMSPAQRRLVRWLGILGYGARMIVFGLAGVLLVRSAVTWDPEDSGGFSDAISTLAESSFGPWVLMTVAIGLACFGLFSLAQARYREVDVPDHGEW
jgi:Mn2+/Fe2+ NRAMP family transporter